jgi:hypothetical protein
MARRMVFLRGQGGEPCASLTDGLALADVAVSVHYGAADPAFAGSHPDEDLAALSMGQGIEILAIPEHSVVIIKESTVSCRGQVFAFRGESRHALEGPDGAQTTDRTGAWT